MPKYTIRRRYYRDGIVLIVLTADDLDRLVLRRVRSLTCITKYKESFDERQLSSTKIATTFSAPPPSG